jgi:hypothetical protein
MNLSLQRYIALTGKSPSSIGKETGRSRQAVEHMLKMKSPVFVKCKQGDDYKQIEELYRYEVLYSASADHKESS